MYEIEILNHEVEEFKREMNNKAKKISKISGKPVLECYKWLLNYNLEDLPTKTSTENGE